MDRALHDPNGEKEAVLQRLQSHFAELPGLRNADVMMVFHGCSHRAADGICETGFASISTTDAGFFGRGMYVTTHPQYAAEYASSVLTGGTPAPNAAGEFVVIAAYACPGLAYPIT